MANVGYFLVADMLGFSRVVSNLSEGELDRRTGEWVVFVKAAASRASVDQLQLISDTVFAAASSTADGLSRLSQFARILLQEGLAKLFPVRGAIVHGSFEWGELIYGRAVVEAHTLERAQNWIGVGCDPALPHIDQFWGIDNMICYAPPMKHGSVRVRPVVSWSIPKTEILLSLAARGGSVVSGEALTWELGEKINNTVQFRLYQEFLRRKGVSCSQFYGIVPSHAIEKLVMPESK